MILYVFISCNSRIDKNYNRITNMMDKLNCDNYIIVTGGNTENKYLKDKHLLEIECNDYYEGLPEKMIKTFKFINENELFKKFTHFCKVDDDIIMNQLISTDILNDYCGKVENLNISPDRRWHINRCSINSKFNTTEYTGRYVPWCAGGHGYIVSRKSLNILASEKKYYNEIYEDVYIANTLYDKNIYPTNISELKKYFYSDAHL